MDRYLRQMSRALQLARRGEGLVEPNPMVGCVIIKNGRTIGEGYHHRFGGPHAEVVALRRCRSSSRGSTVVVTLEPCHHQGKTPPCTEALMAAGVRRVVVGTRDPNPLVAGRGIKRLRSAGIDVVLGVLESEARELIAPFATRHRLGRPFVIAKWAQGLNGPLAWATGNRRWISSETSRRIVHRLRARVDAIAVGCKTVTKDDPELTARNVVRRRTALRVVFDTHLKTPTGARLIQTSPEVPTIIFCQSTAVAGVKARRLRQAGAQVIALPVRAGRLDVPAALQWLADRDVTNLMVEGGPALLTSFLDAGVVDEALVFVAPMMITPYDPRLCVAWSRVAWRSDLEAAGRWGVRRSGPDVLFHFRRGVPTGRGAGRRRGGAALGS